MFASKHTRAAVLVAAACCTLAGSASAQDGPPRAGQVFGDWRFDCTAITEAQSRCQLTQTMLAGELRQAVARLGLAPDADGGMVLSALLPLGFSIPAGVRVAIDEGETIPLDLVRCVTAGCIAGHTLSADEITALRLGVLLAISFDSAAGRTITLAGSLDGISAGLDATGWDG
ncbi:invasion protein B-like protein [Octadecabacter antarcticus 307]|uniref:Invasion protein B-like protein n=1 Tax=Octadecabacter antarcticus 307 TaxID=391626 RepID=M9RA19_9RHOB|nr:invasion associated locus B family protein [Octadecabacter antarcticus]AGI69027.1 invasion protein B-like protein [Octadecabacter antarcticus 307]